MKNSVYGVLWLLSGVALAQSIPLNQADIQYIYDADTFFVQCPECKNGKRGVRVMGVDSPEIRGRCQAEKVLARQAKQFAVEKIRAAKTIELVPNAKRRYDRYDRLLAWVRLDGRDLGVMLIDAECIKKWGVFFEKSRRHFHRRFQSFRFFLDLQPRMPAFKMIV